MEPTLLCSAILCCFNQLHHHLATLLQLSFYVWLLFKYYVVSLLQKRCLITTLRHFFNCSLVDGHLSSSTNVNSLTTMAQASWKCLTLGKQQYFLFGMLFLKSKNYQLCKKLEKPLPPLATPMPNNLLNSFNVLLLPGGSYCYALFSEKKQETGNMKQTKFLNEKCKD